MGKEDVFTRMRLLGEQKIRATAQGRLRVLSTDGSAWLRLAASLAAAAASGSPSAFISPAAEIALRVADLQTEQHRMLSSIEHQVGILRRGPFLVGCDFVTEAAHTASGPKSQQLLESGAHKFRQARANAATATELGVVEAHLGFVKLALGETSEAQRRLTSAHEVLRAEADSLAAIAEDVRVLKSRASTGLAILYYPSLPVVAVRKWRLVRKAELARLALVELQPVVTALAQSVLALNGERLGTFEVQYTGEHFERREFLAELPSA